jgi:hypothetical protein
MMARGAAAGATLGDKVSGVRPRRPFIVSSPVAG